MVKIDIYCIENDQKWERERAKLKSVRREEREREREREEREREILINTVIEGGMCNCMFVRQHRRQFAVLSEEKLRSENYNQVGGKYRKRNKERKSENTFPTFLFIYSFSMLYKTVSGRVKNKNDHLKLPG